MLKLTHAEDLQIFLAMNWNFLLDERRYIIKIQQIFNQYLWKCLLLHHLFSHCQYWEWVVIAVVAMN